MKGYDEFIIKLGMLETGGKAAPYQAENQFGFIGKYQMGELSLEDSGSYKGMVTENR